MPQALHLCHFIILTMEVVETIIFNRTMVALLNSIEVLTTIREDTLVATNRRLFIQPNSRLRIRSRDIIYKMALEGTVIFKSLMADSSRRPKARENQHSTISLEIIIQQQMYLKSVTALINGTSHQH